MIVYALGMFTSMLFARSYHRLNTNNKYIYAFLSFIPLFLISALRKFVGTDYMSYLYILTPDILSGQQYYEFGFQYLVKLCVLFLGDFQWLIFSLSFIYCFFTFKTLYRYSANIPLSILILVSFGCYYFSLNTMRQACAISIFFYSIKYIEFRNMKLYLLCVSFACVFHYSALIFLPLYFFLNRRISYKSIFIVSFCIYIVWPLFSLWFYSIFLGRYFGYFSWGIKSGYNWRYLIPLCAIILLDLNKNLYHSFQSIPVNAPINLFRNLFILSFWACNLSPTLTGDSAARVIHFFLPSIAIYIPFLVNFYPTKIKQLVYISLAFLFFWTSKQNSGWILPYHSIFSDYTMDYSEFIHRVYENSAR